MPIMSTVAGPDGAAQSLHPRARWAWIVEASLNHGAPMNDRFPVAPYTAPRVPRL